MYNTEIYVTVQEFVDNGGKVEEGLNLFYKNDIGKIYYYSAGTFLKHHKDEITNYPVLVNGNGKFPFSYTSVYVKVGIQIDFGKLLDLNYVHVIGQVI